MTDPNISRGFMGECYSTPEAREELRFMASALRHRIAMQRMSRRLMDRERMVAQSRRQAPIVQIPVKHEPQEPKGSRESTISRLEKLPAELKTEICSYLDYKSVLNVSMTSRRLHYDIGPARCTYNVKTEFLLRAQEFRKHRPTGVYEYKDRQKKPGEVLRRLVMTPSGRYGNLACFRCNVVLAAEEFSRHQRSRSRLSRFCLKCGRAASLKNLALGPEMKRRSRASGEATGASE
ncbi:hypothetical protein RB598_009533 [Gaeumannomyces tritici]